MLVQAHARRIVEVVNCVDAINCDQNTYTWLQLDLVGKGYNEAMCRYWPLGFDTQGTERSLPGVALHSGPTKTSGPSLHPSWVHEKAAASSKWRWVCCCRGATSSEVKSSCQPMPCYLANRSTFLYCNQFNSIHMSGSINKRVDAWKKMPNMLPHNTCSWKHCNHIATTDPVLRDTADKACISAPFDRRSPERTDRISPTEKHEETRETHLRKTEETGVVLVVPVYSSPTHITRISRMIKVWLWTASGRCHKCGKDGEANRGTTVEYRSISWSLIFNGGFTAENLKRLIRWPLSCNLVCSGWREGVFCTQGETRLTGWLVYRCLPVAYKAYNRSTVPPEGPET